MASNQATFNPTSAPSYLSNTTATGAPATVSAAYNNNPLAPTGVSTVTVEQRTVQQGGSGFVSSNTPQPLGTTSTSTTMEAYKTSSGAQYYQGPAQVTTTTEVRNYGTSSTASGQAVYRGAYNGGAMQTGSVVSGGMSQGMSQGMTGMSTTGMSTGMTGMSTGMTGMTTSSGMTGGAMSGGAMYAGGMQGAVATQETVMSGGGAMGAYESGRRVSVRGQEVVTGTRVVGHEYGEQRVISVTSHVDESRSSIISERYVEHEVRVPKRIVREEIIEKVIIVPERIVHEEVIDEVQIVREKIIEVSKPVIQEKIVEIPEIEYVEKLIEVPERVVQEKIREVPKIEYQERIIEVPKIVTQERIVEVPEIQYREVPFERIVEVPEIREEVVVREVPVPQYIDKPVPEYVDVEVNNDVERNIPVPVEAVTSFEYRMPRLRPRYNKVSYPVYLPRFVEVPVAMELLTAELSAAAEKYLAQIRGLPATAASLCEVENLAANIMKAEFQNKVTSTDLHTAVMSAWQNGMLQFSAAPMIAAGSVAGVSRGMGTATTTTYTATATAGPVQISAGITGAKKSSSHKKHSSTKIRA